ncbi:MAG: ribonuclease D [Rhizobiaceae bacterium]|nr:ribonuclease D [Rhizobiaceae bacterium]
MKIITDTKTLAQTCREISKFDYVTVDTEFLRETTFWPKLCLLQLGWPQDAVIVDVLAKDIDLAPFFELMGDESVVKVFHAARQDIEIIYKLGHLLPTPVFDSQVAAMVCGFGDSISYDQLVYKITGEQVDKSSRFTDWSKRPLSEKQLDYALGDVTHLRNVYLSIKANLEEQNRAHWVAEEMQILTSVETYDMPPENAWKRLKMRARKPRELAIMQHIARWRETTARANDVPRGRVIKDDVIYEIMSNPPRNESALGAMRGIKRGFDRNRYGAGLLEAVANALAVPNDQLPTLPKPRQAPEGTGAAAEMLKVLLKLTVEEEGVAAKVIANVADLERIAADDNADVSALRGWRRELFGERALKLKNGEIALGFSGRKITVIELGENAKRMAAE